MGVTQAQNGDGATAPALRRRSLVAAGLAGVLLVTLAALALVGAPSASAGPRTIAGHSSEPSGLRHGGDGPVPTSASRDSDGDGDGGPGHREPDGDDHGIDHNGPAAPSDHYVRARVAADAALSSAAPLERCCLTVVRAALSLMTPRFCALGDAGSRAPPLAG